MQKSVPGQALFGSVEPLLRFRFVTEVATQDWRACEPRM
jgi:hypothetical protein